MTADTSSIKSSYDEKKRRDHVEEARSNQHPNVSAEDAAWLDSFPEERKKKVIWKVDIRLIPLLTLLYLFSFIDRANIGNAKIEGLTETLNMSSTQYNVVLSIFFVPYVIFEVPSNYILSKFKKPSMYIGGIIVAWGIVMTLMGIVHNFEGLVAVRFMLGVAEAGFFPGAVYIISSWYLPHEMQSRIALFYAASALAGAVSGLLAFAIARMDGVGGYEGWRWIFLLEGIATVLAGVLCLFCLIDSPEMCQEGVDWEILRAVVTDWQVYLQSLIYLSSTIPNYGMKFTMPQIITNMGYTSSMAQVLTIPPYIAGAISAYCAAVFADRLHWRMPFIVGSQLIVLIAFAILFAKAADIKNNIAVCYFGVVLACIGLYPINPGCNAWTVSNLAGPTKRAMGIAYMISMGNAGGIPGSYIYFDSEAPKYPTGFGVSLGIAALGVCSALTLELTYTALNKSRKRICVEEVYETYTQDELDAMGDRSPLFKYTL
ncbi:hypothetical protein ASPVEDRAFT_877783 [Aspergillus versicolor CBS 583.65]|uniref:Major facilitator superfamily (MFS) profile domain-containing protein n=1 Tax=Aspergillus versicolor CBS 583.65 TaxID=1036611 RepID=A0A1L9Q1Y3_ASPVE|nr:uncharacterized protein ASPVEDRAFT_877783 [Aspergillus versicolor CBS 583.65]OJJ07726.1 hypothetical protein ASPVEDRAFT_877783 [Aspergillus versicolor CBS 583.65]